MKRRSKNVVAYVLAAFFAFGILCSTLAAPGHALASISGCSQTPGPMAMAGCDYPNYLCGFDPATNLLSRGALSPALSNDSLKNVLGLALGGPFIDASIDLVPPGARDRKNLSFAAPGKISIRLFNSILNL